MVAVGSQFGCVHETIKDTRTEGSVSIGWTYRNWAYRNWTQPNWVRPDLLANQPHHFTCALAASG